MWLQSRRNGGCCRQYYLKQRPYLSGLPVAAPAGGPFILRPAIDIYTAGRPGFDKVLYFTGISGDAMSGKNDRAKTALVLALFAMILLLTYFWPIPLHVTDLRNLTPGPLRGELDSYLAKYPEQQWESLQVPPPEIPVQLNSTLNDPVVTRGELNATRWIVENTSDSDVFVADIFGAELIMGMTTRVSTEGGDWANAPDPILKMSDTNEFFTTPDPARAHALATGLNATYAFVPETRRLNTGWWVNATDVQKEKFLDTWYFQKVYGNEDVTIYKIL